MNRKTLVLAAAMGLAAPVIAACGDTGGGSGGDEPIVVGTTDRFTASEEEGLAPLDPAYAYQIGTWSILRQTVQTLMVQPRGEGQPVPDAAESCRFTDAGNQRYSCTLRDGLTFANGDAVTAADVKYSIERALAIKAESQVFALLSNIDTVETKGAGEVIFHLKAADATFPYKLSTPVAGIINPDDYKQNQLREGFEVSGSGPYTLDAEVVDNRIVKATFTRNPSYKGALKLRNDQVELRTYDTSDEMEKALENGDIQVMTRSMSPDQIQELANAPKKNIELVESPGLEIRYLVFNTKAETVEDKAVRQAMAQIIDRGKLVSDVYGTQAEPLFSLVPSGVTGHNNAFFNEYGEPSVDKARELLDEAGVSMPVKLTLHYTNDHYGPTAKAEFEQLSKQLNDSGLFTTDIKGVPWAEFGPASREGSYAVYGMGWFPEYPDAEAFIAPFLAEDNVLNTPYVNDRIRKELLPQSRRQADRASASRSLTAIQNIVADDVPLLPLWQGKQYVATRDDITGSAYVVNSSSILQLWELGRGSGN